METFLPEKRGGLGVGRMELLPAGMKAVRKVEASPVIQRGIDQIPCHRLHPPLGFRRPFLDEKHHKRNHGTIGVTQESVHILVDGADGHVQQISLVTRHDLPQRRNKRKGAAGRNEILVENIGG